MVKLEKQTLQHLLNQCAEDYADKTAVAFVEGEEITYGEFNNRVKNVSHFLKEKGIIAGDKIAILSENQPNWTIAYFAITTMGAVAVPIMTEFNESEVHHILRHSESKAIFISAKYYNKIEESEIADLETLILIDDFSIIPRNTKTDYLKEVITGGKREFSKIKEAALKLVGKIHGEIYEDDVAAILYTSGTTGHSKGVILTHKNIVSNAFATLEVVTLSASDKMLSILPLFHTIESTLGLITPFIAGASIYYLSKPPTAGVLLPALKIVKPTVMLSVPLVIEKIYKMKILPEINKKFVVRSLYKLPAVRKKINNAAGKKLYKTFGGRLKMFCLGGAPLSFDVERFLKEAGFPYAIGYGLTETSPLATGTPPEKVRFRSAGTSLPGVEVKISDPDEKNGEGEVLIKGPNVMRGYYKDPEKTKSVFTKDGWFKSGDLGVIDDDGYLFIKGRSKNVIIGSNGKNIYPEEIESIINSCENVMESLVHEKGDQLIARVHLNYEEIDEKYEIQKLTGSETRKIIDTILKNTLNEVNEKVSTFSRINKIIEHTEQFEKTPTQKIKRYLYV